MNTIQLITSGETIQICPAINKEIDGDLINSTILLIQDTLIKSSLTEDFYIDLVTNSGTTDNQYLINNFIKNIIAYGVWQSIVIQLSLQLNAAGLRVKTSDHSDAAQNIDLEFYRSYIQQFIDTTRKSMDRYIYDNQNKYPLYWSDKWGDKPVTNGFKFGFVNNNRLYTDRDNDCCDYRRTI